MISKSLSSTRSGVGTGFRIRSCANLKSAHGRHVDEFPRGRHRADRNLDQRGLAGSDSGLERGAQLLRVARAPASGAEAFGIFDEIRIGEVRCDEPVAELLLLDAAHIAEGAIREYHRLAV